MSRLRHRIRPHSGLSRHLNPPFSADRRHGGRLHLKAEGHEAKERRDRPRKRDVGGATSATPGTTSGMTPAQMQMLQQQQAMNQPPTTAMPYNPTAVKRGGRVHKHRKHGGRIHRADGGPTGSQLTNQAQQPTQQQMMGNLNNPGLGQQYQASQIDQQNKPYGGRKDGGGKWIQKAIKRPGALHRALHVPEGEKIPAKKLAKASHSEDPRVRRMVGLAKTLKKMH